MKSDVSEIKKTLLTTDLHSDSGFLITNYYFYQIIENTPLRHRHTVDEPRFQPLTK
jgi:hypothetical protein